MTTDQLVIQARAAEIIRDGILRRKIDKVWVAIALVCFVVGLIVGLAVPYDVMLVHHSDVRDVRKLSAD